MLSKYELATVRAALRYWQEEMCPHGSAAIWPYWDTRSLVTLTAAEVAELRKRILPKNVGYTAYNVATRQLVSCAISLTASAARKRAGAKSAIATLLLPASS